jgi:hypothetical protein
MKTRWNCPWCAMSSNRHWNVRRHISRIHDGVGQPTSNFMRQDDRNPNSIASGFNYSRSGRGSYSYSQDHISTKEQRTKTLLQSMDQFIEPMKKLVEFQNLLDQLFVSGQQQACKQFFSPTIVPSAEFEGYEQQPTSAHHPNPISEPDFYGHIKLTAQKFAFDCNKPVDMMI